MESYLVIWGGTEIIGVVRATLDVLSGDAMKHSVVCVRS